MQTEADRSAQRFIVNNLNSLYPDINVIGEEELAKTEKNSATGINEENNLTNWTCPSQYSDLVEKDIVVWVDPLDGTSEYTQGFLEHVTVLIGIAANNKAIGGVIHQPFFKTEDNKQGRTIWGLKGMGIGGINPIQPAKDKFIVTTTRSHSTEIVQNAIAALSPDEVLKVGGAGYKVLQLIEGKAHAYVFASPGCKKWDTCAPEAVLEAYGGTLTDMFGASYEYGKNVEYPNKLGVFATTKGINHTELINKLPKSLSTLLQ